MDVEKQLKELEQRRKRGMRLLGTGVWPAEVARRVGVSRQSVLRWSVQRPTGRARQRDEAAIRTWKDKRWPAIKKSQRGRGE